MPQRFIRACSALAVRWYAGKVNCFFFSSRRRHTICLSDWSSDVCSSDLSIPDGDGTSEMYLTEVPGATVGPGKRDLIVESVYEYGSRAGFWRFMRMFADRNIDITVFGAALALERNPDAAK